MAAHGDEIDRQLRKGLRLDHEEPETEWLRTRNAMNARVPVGWWGRFVGAVALLVDAPSEILFVRATSAAGAGSVSVLTDKFMVVVGIANISNDGTDITTEVVSRSAVRSLSVWVGVGVGDWSIGVEWPGAVTIAANYEGIERPVVFSGQGFHEPGDDLPAIRVVLNELRQDLARSSRP